MAPDRIHDKGADSWILGALGADEKIGEGVARGKFTIGKPKMVEAGLLRGLAGFDELLRIEKIKTIGAESHSCCSLMSAIPVEINQTARETYPALRSA